MSFVSLCFFVFFGLSLASVPAHVARPVIDDAIWEAYGGATADISAGAGARIPQISASATDTDIADGRVYPHPTSPATGRDADRYNYEDRGCNADCRVRYSPVTVYEWQPVSITATSTIKVVVTGGAEVARNPQNLMIPDVEEAGEFHMKNGVPYSALTLPILGNEGQNAQKTAVIDVFYPTPVTVYPTSYNWDGKLMTPIGNPQIGMVLTCLRNVKSPINGKLSPMDGKDPWELGNLTAPTDYTSFDDSFWRLVPMLRKPDQEHIKSAFKLDLALGYCKMSNGNLSPITIEPQYGIRYVTVTSTLVDVPITPVAAVVPLLESQTLQSIPTITDAPNMHSMPGMHDMPGMSVASSPAVTSPSKTKQSGPYKHSKTWQNNLQGMLGTQASLVPNVRTEQRATDTVLAGPQSSKNPPISEQAGAFTVHTEKTASSLMGPTALPIVTSQPPALPTEAPISHTEHLIQSLIGLTPSSIADALGGSQPSRGSQRSQASDPVVAVEPPAPIYINNQRLKPNGPHKYVSNDGQELLLDGPPILLSSGERGSDHKMQVNLVSGPSGADVLVVDGARQTLTNTAATGKPRPARLGGSSMPPGGMYPDDYYSGMDMGNGGYPGYGSPNGGSGPGSVRGGGRGPGSSPYDDTSPNSPASLGKARPAKFDGGAQNTAIDWSVGAVAGVLAFAFAL